MREGDHLGEFTLLEGLRRGASWVAYVAFEDRTRRLAEIRVLLPESARDPVLLGAFQRAAEAYRAMAHPNVVRFLDAGCHQGVCFVATEHVKGRSLAEILQEYGALSLDASVKIVLHLAQALAHAHEHGVLLRDLKPPDVAISEEGDVKLRDLHFLSEWGDVILPTAGGPISLQPGYGSPEAIQNRHLDERSDLYSLGLLFYELLTGRRALQGPTLHEVTAFVTRGRIPHPSQIDATIPRAIDGVVMKLLQKNPEWRFASAEALVAELQAFSDRAWGT
jgi:serine/threonine-protein kinase